MGSLAAVGREGDSPNRIHVLVVDGRRMVADSLRAALGQVAGLSASASVTVAHAVEMARTLRPDVALVDSRMPDGTAPEATQLIRDVVPEVRVIVISDHEDELALSQALDAGCRGFVVTSRGLDELVAAVRAVHSGDVVVPQPLLTRMLIRGAAPERQGLTHREVDVLRLLAEGLPNPAIARRLRVSIHTVRNHTQSILRKLGAHSKLEAVSTAIREGIVPPPS